MIRTLCRRKYEVPIEVGQMVHHNSLGWGMISYISPHEQTVCPIKVHFEHKAKFVSFTVTGKEFVSQVVPVVDFGAQEILPVKLSTEDRFNELFDDLQFLKEQKPELGIGNIQYNRNRCTFTITLN